MTVAIPAERQTWRLRQRLTRLGTRDRRVDRDPCRPVPEPRIKGMRGARQGSGDAAADQGNLQFGHLALLAVAAIRVGWFAAIDARRVAAAEILPGYRNNSGGLSGRERAQR